MEIKEIEPVREKLFELTVTKTELKALLKGVVDGAPEVSFKDWQQAKDIAGIK